MSDTDLYPTKARLALLRDVDDGKVCDHSTEFAPYLRLDDGDLARVADAIWGMERAGWVMQPAASMLWELTDKGREILAGAGAT
jgi:hypothetical protein